MAAHSCTAAAAAALGVALLALLLQLLAAGAAPTPPPITDEEDDPGVFQRLKAYCRSYTIGRGLTLMYNDDDIKCLLMVSRAMRKDFSPMVQPAATLFNFIMHTSPRCKLSLVAKGRMFLDPEFLKGVVNVLFGSSSTLAAEPTPSTPRKRNFA